MKRFAYAVPVFRYLHLKDAAVGKAPRWGVLANTKCLMKESIARWEGFVGLFGGHLEIDEEPLEGVLRELEEEMAFNVDAENLVHVDHFSESESDITIYAFDMGVLDEDRLRLLASQCKEGIVFPILSETQFAGDVKWTFPKFGDAVNRARDKIRGI